MNVNFIPDHRSLPKPHFVRPEQRILGIDSGSGYLSPLLRFVNLLPRERVTVVADRAGHPYGDGRTLDQVSQSVASACLPFLESGDYKAVFLMCNTASHPEILAMLYWEFGVQVLGKIHPGSRDLLHRYRREDGAPLRIGLMDTATLLRERAWQESLLAHARLLGMPVPQIGRRRELHPPGETQIEELPLLRLCATRARPLG